MTNAPLAMPKTPYYEDELVQIWHANSLPMLSMMPDDSYDIILTDPPYNEVNRAGSVDQRTGAMWFDMDKGGADDLPIDVYSLAREISRVSSQWAYVFCGWKQVSMFLYEFEEQGMSIRMGGWQKASPVPIAASLNWLTAFEALAIGRHPKASFNAFAETPVFYGEKEHKTIHPTQKPLWLTTQILQATTPSHSGVTVLDPFMGSGSTIEAAKKHGLKAIGIEINEEYCEAAANRLSQDTLF